MLSQVNYWTQVAGTVIDAFLLLRVLSLRLQRTYVFITLACAVVIIFDAADLWFGQVASTSARIFLYTRFLYAILFPLVVWDVFEEIKGRITKVRRLAIGRLLSGIFFTTLLAFVLAIFMESDDVAGESPVVATLALVLWAGSTTASLSFLVSIHRVLRAQPLEIPNNTSVWMRFYEMNLASEVLVCFLIIILPLFKSQTANDGLNLFFLLFGIVITSWCIWRLRRIPSEEAGQEGEQAPL